MREELLPSNQDIEFFNQNGYWISKKVISDERLELLRERMEQMYKGKFDTGRTPWIPYWTNGDSPTMLRKTDNAHLADRAVFELATDPLIGEMAAKLMDTDLVKLWVTQLLYKPGRNKGTGTANVGWHQDFRYWQCTYEPTIFTAWVAFDDVSIENGCMRMIPESHKWGLINANDFFEQDLKKQEESMQLPEGKEFEPVPIVMKAGQISFHHSLTIHGSGPNISDRPRRSIAIHLLTGETRYKRGLPSWDQHPFLPSLASQPDGEMITGDDFPLVYAR